MRPLFIGVVGATLAPSLAFAVPPVTSSYRLGVVSDYQTRGLTFSDHRPALQGQATVSARDGLYGWAWGSTIQDYGGANAEIGLAIGWAGGVGGATLDVAVSRYVYPGGVDVDFWELPASLARTQGDWTWTLGAAWAPPQHDLGDQDNRYGYAAATWAPTYGPLALTFQLGHEHGALSPEPKWDWSLGATRHIGGLELGLSYVGGDRAGDTVVASVMADF